MSIITLNTRSLPDSAVTTAKIAADAITDAKIADDAVVAANLADNAVSLSASSVTGTLPVANGGTGLTSGTTNQFLKFTGSTTLASADDNKGKILQVVQSTTTSDIYTNSSSYVASGFTGAITPSATSSKILIQLNGGYIDYDSAALDAYCRIFYKIGSGSYAEQASFTRTRVNSAFGIPNSQNFLTSPNTTSEVTVQPYIKSSTSNNAYINRQSALLTLTLLEIGA